MIERASEFGASQAAPLVVGDTSQMSAGDMLREAREAHGLHIEVVAAALKVSTQKLEALENDDIDALPDPVFARALAASVCRAFKIDPAPVLAKLPGSPRAGLADADRTISTSFRSGAPRAGRSGAGWRPSRLLVAVVVILLLGTAAIFWLPQSTFEQLSASIARITARGDAAIGASTEPETPEAARAPGTVVESVVPSAQPVAPAAAGLIGATTSPAATVQDGVPAQPANASGNILVFVARADSWITVSEAGGKQLLRRTVTAGETVGLSGTLPLSVVVGRASGVDVQVRGKAFDLAPVTKGGGIARFEVKS
ncbi:helix-turn-helix domain-containing protein [Variovorax sp. PAMC 28711]|uniref:helix-turn-helix domain-containing protein n=1 Tax=Variovorax sp. PAMC 28711 TaxID=1795631 RepID=UPI00078C7D4C|nr:helix-turn-helix domain-containing protein [Variovorax sp. PAMC 28711]AMM23062.1 hypothetical protein AX767_00745 [Variovorax sp. PAMC 28711]